MQNFGKIKNVFNDLFVEGVINKKAPSRELFKKYLRYIKENEILKTQFLVYSNIENRIDSDLLSANIFISENIKLLEKYKHSDIIKENNKLVNLLGNDSNKLNDKYDLDELHESLTNLIFTKRTPKNINKITEEIKRIGTYISSNKVNTPENIHDLPISMLSKIMVEKYNEKYANLDEETKKIVKLFISSELEEKRNFYNEIVSECKVLVSRLINETDNSEINEKLLKVSKKLDETQVTDDELLINIANLATLKKSLQSQS
jgi:hypothetical protein